MKVDRVIIKSERDFVNLERIQIKPNLLFIFGDRELLCDQNFQEILDRNFSDVIKFGCSSAGEIMGLEVHERSITITAVEFELTEIKIEDVLLTNYKNSVECGEVLCEKFKKNGLKHIMVLSDGVNVNGACLVEGIQNKLPNGIAVTGGLAGDGVDFNKTFVYDKLGKPIENCVSAIGFYGNSLDVAYGSNGGWNSFGLERLVTKSDGNILYEVDGQPALLLYKEFLGEKVNELPAAGLLFPLSLRQNDKEEPVVRTIHGVNDEDQSLVFAGNIPEGSYVKLMKANVDRLINGAELSAEASIEMIDKGESELAILISCVGRKLVLKQLVEEEVEAVSEVLGNQAKITGFYSYGEIAPFRDGSGSVLHNQTMTVTTFSEK